MPNPDLILIALDESPIKNLLERALQASGYSTAIAQDIKSLEKVLQENSPALVFLGEHIKGENGIQLSQNLLDRFPTLPILMYVERDSPVFAKEALRVGIAGYLYPPLHTDEIINAIRQCLKRAQHLGDWVRREVHKTTASLEKRVDELETLVKLGSTITGTLELDVVLTNVVVAAVEMTSAEEGSLLLLDEDSGELYMRASHHFEEKHARAYRLPIIDTLAGEVIKKGKPVILGEKSRHKVKTDHLVYALIYVPLRLKDHVIGVLTVDNRQHQRPFTDHHVLLMSVLSDYAALAIENARLYQISEAERAKFEATFSNMNDGVLILDDKRHIIFTNKSLRSSFNLGTTPVEGHLILDAIPHPDLGALLTTSKDNESRFHEINLVDGRTYNAVFTPIPGVGSAIIMQDITYLKDLDRLKNDFIHTISHDLRSPLTAVLGYAELLERAGELGTQQREYVRRIQASVQNITVLVNDLLDLGRIEAGFDTLRESIHLESILQHSLENLQPQIDNKKLHVQVNIAPGLPFLRGNPIRLRQMLDNLLGNAMKYTPAGGEVQVELRPEGDQVILRVNDTGTGIPPNDQPHIFDKFFRASNVPAEIPGSGLGLAIVKSIVDNHYGRIWVESTLDQGSTFFVVLPAQVKERGR